jgi:hypothetical protein
LNKIEAITYSPYLNQYDTSTYGQFDLYLDVLKTAGDTNGDGKINSQDITAAIRIVLQLDSATPTADASGDGKVDALDIALIEWIILNTTP